jgi:hypothetical protein
MTAFVKPLMVCGFAVGSLAVAGGQQFPDPPQPPAAPTPPSLPATAGRPALMTTADGVVYAQGGGFGGSFGRGGFSPFGDDPRTKELVKKLVDAKDDEVKEKLRGELKTALAKAFDDRLKNQEKQVEELEKQLKKLKEMVGKRKEAKAEIIADRMTALEKDAKGLGW